MVLISISGTCESKPVGASSRNVYVDRVDNPRLTPRVRVVPCEERAQRHDHRARIIRVPVIVPIHRKGEAVQARRVDGDVLIDTALIDAVGICSTTVQIEVLRTIVGVPIPR